ncbi:MAG: hypothetical protein ACKVZJ_00005, partial [Phycisphaerales bacterium]
MRRDVVVVSTLAAALGFVSSASGLTVPFTETFAGGNASWTNSANAPLEAVGAGGPDGSSYASGVFNFAGTNAQSTPAILRAQNTTNASGGSFFGNWVTQNVTTLSFDIRHDAPVSLDVFVRWTGASAPAFPGIILFASSSVPSGAWTSVTMAISSGAAFVPEPGGTYAGIFPQVARMQFGATPGSLAGQNVAVRFDIDNVRIVPGPGVVALVGLAGIAGLRRRR